MSADEYESNLDQVLKVKRSAEDKVNELQKELKVVLASAAEPAVVDNAEVERLSEELATATARITELEGETVAKDEYLETQKRDMLSLMRSSTQVAREESVRQKLLNARDTAEQRVDELDQEIENKDAVIKEKDEMVEEMKKMLEE